MRIHKLLTVILSLAIILAVCASVSGCVSEPDESSAEASSLPFESDNPAESSSLPPESELPKAPTEEDIANAQKTVLLTDKKVYDIDDELTLTIKAPNETDEIEHGTDCHVQYFNTETDEWTDFLIKESIQELLWLSCGESGYSFTLSKRADAGYEKYRLKHDVTVNKVNLTLYSEEFTINNG